VRKKRSFTCPNCGASVRAGARACPECGSDEKTGWSPNADTAGLDLPAGYGNDEEFDYDAFVRREFGGKKRRPAGLSVRAWLMIALTVTIVVAFLLMQLR